MIVHVTATFSETILLFNYQVLSGLLVKDESTLLVSIILSCLTTREDLLCKYIKQKQELVIDGSRTAATCKMERFVIIVNDGKPPTIITKRYILDVAAVLDPPLLVKESAA